MGEEIRIGHFTEQDFSLFADKLETETQLLKKWFAEKHFSDEHECGGCELEAWLVDEHAMPTPNNVAYLDALDNPLVVPELSKFNIELNTTPQTLQGNALRLMEQELQHTWDTCRQQAQAMQNDLVMIGILPTVRDTDLTLANMSHMVRYKALNQQVMRMREGRPLVLDIRGEEHLKSTHYDVMLESAATSFQIHVQVPLSKSTRYYNAAQIVSAPMVAACVNSPFLFGKQLWEETRIPLFERAVEVGGLGGAAFGPLHRVSFGSGYAHDSLFECFLENQQHFPVLLPRVTDNPAAQMDHLRLHNGTIWRWNRPLIGFNNDGTPHLRIEHRVVPAGPTVVDAVANMALLYGLLKMLVDADTAPEKEIDFAMARDNFYAAARRGLQAQFNWKGKNISARQLLLEELIPMAREGLQRFELDSNDIEDYLGIIEERVSTGYTGAHWQRACAQRLSNDMQSMTVEYLQQQHRGTPVHDWPYHDEIETC